MGRKHGFSFSWKRATGVSGFKNRISKKTGIPLSRSGRQRKVGRATGCFIATVAYGDYDSENVRFLRTFRDEILLQNHLGRIFVMFYYRVGPFLASLLSTSPLLIKLSRTFLNFLIRLIKKFTSLK